MSKKGTLFSIQKDIQATNKAPKISKKPTTKKVSQKHYDDGAPIQMSINSQEYPQTSTPSESFSWTEKLPQSFDHSEEEIWAETKTDTPATPPLSTPAPSYQQPTQEKPEDNKNIPEELFELDKELDKQEAKGSLATDDDIQSFQNDLQAILSGQKTYEGPQSQEETKPKEQPKAQEKKQAPSTDNGQHAIFDKIAKSKSFDFGTIDLSNHFASLDAELEAKTNKAPLKSTEQSIKATPEYTQFDELDDAYELQKMKESHIGISTQKSDATPPPKTIVVVESSNNDNGFLPNKAGKNPGCLRVTSIENMVDQVLNNLASGQKIQSLTIYGHGAPGNVSVGDGQGWLTDKHINGNRSEWEPHLTKLKDRFAPNATLFLGGCNTGANEDGAKKLQELADFLNITVSAPTGKVYSNCTEERGSRHQTARPGQTRPAAIGTPSDEKKEKDRPTTQSLIQNQWEEVESIHIHTAKEPIDSPEHAAYQFSSTQEVKTILNGIDNSKSFDSSIVSGKKNAQIFIRKNGAVQKYIVFSDYDYFLKEGDWQNTYEVKWELKQMLKELLERPQNNLLS